MMLRALVIGTLALVAASCGEPRAPEAPDGPSSTHYGDSAAMEDGESAVRGELDPVDPALLAAANSSFTAIEPSELGVFAAEDVMQALGALLGPEAFEEDANVNLSLRESPDEVIADIVRTGIPDDAVSAGHIRIEFRREADGWFPTNAYRRSQCRRGERAEQWTSGLCP